MITDVLGKVVQQKSTLTRRCSVLCATKPTLSNELIIICESLISKFKITWKRLLKSLK